MIRTLFVLFLLLNSIPVFAQKIVIVINSMNKVGQISKDQLQDYFFKRIRNWPDGQAVRFFDRADGSPERETFLKDYIRKTSRQVDQFWLGQKFNTGDSSPIQVNANSMTLNLVSRFPGGISYVPEGTALPKNVKLLEISE